MGASGWTHLDVRQVKKETPKAFLLVLTTTLREVWVPKSVIDSPDSYEEGDKNAVISVKDWFAEKEGLADG